MRARELEVIFDDVMRHLGRQAVVRTTAATLSEWTKQARFPGPQRSRRQVSSGLTAYRLVRDKKYSVSCRGYGKAAFWYVCGIDNRPSINRTDTTAKQVEWIAQDAVERMYSDLRHEYLPAARMNNIPKRQIDMRIAAFETHAIEQLIIAGVNHREASKHVAELGDKLRKVS